MRILIQNTDLLGPGLHLVWKSSEIFNVGICFLFYLLVHLWMGCSTCDGEQHNPDILHSLSLSLFTHTHTLSGCVSVQFYVTHSR